MSSLIRLLPYCVNQESKPDVTDGVLNFRNEETDFRKNLSIDSLKEKNSQSQNKIDFE